jgi:transmembrane sensor
MAGNRDDDPGFGDDIDWSALGDYFAGRLPAAERLALERWIASEPARAGEVSRLRRIWERASVTADLAGEIDSQAAWAELRQRMRAAQHAATTPDAREPDAAANSLDLPAHRGRRTAGPISFSKESASRTRRRVLVAGGLLAAAAALIWVRARSADRRPSTTDTTRHYVTARGERWNITLTDGTTLSLAPESRLSVPETFDLGRRTVDLEGEAAFDVRHDAQHPFILRTPHAITEDRGTRFDVRDYPGDDGTSVVVGEGSVNLHASQARAADTLVLRRGQRGAVTATGRLIPASHVNVDQYFAWTSGQLVFADTPLSDALPQLGRWYDLEFLVEDPALAARHLTATLHGEPAARVLDMIAAALDARIDRRGRTVTLRSTRHSRAASDTEPDHQ